MVSRYEERKENLIYQLIDLEQMRWLVCGCILGMLRDIDVGWWLVAFCISMRLETIERYSNCTSAIDNNSWHRYILSLGNTQKSVHVISVCPETQVYRAHSHDGYSFRIIMHSLLMVLHCMINSRSIRYDANIVYSIARRRPLAS